MKQGILPIGSQEGGITNETNDALPVAVGENVRGRETAGFWFGLAIGSLLLAGCFAIFLVVGRMPPFSSWLTDAGFFKRCLVVHVNLSLVVWFYSFVAALFALLPARGRPAATGPVGFALAVVGVAVLAAGIFLPGATPILSNYIPALDHVAFLVGLALFLGGVGLSFIGPRLMPAEEAEHGLLTLPEEARPGLRAAAVAFLFALLTFIASALTLPADLPAESHYELLFWGGGHVLQFASFAAMLASWIILLTPALGHSPVSRRAAVRLFGLLSLPTFAAPLLALWGVQRGEVHQAFTDLMRWGIFPVALVFLGLCLRGLWRARVERPEVLTDPRVLAFVASAALTIAGFVLGAFIRGSNTVVPAHYHASIGAVTAAFMGVTYPLLKGLGLGAPGPRLDRLSRIQPAIFGVGQFVFAVGFALAGAQGMARKTYAAEQHIRTTLESAGLVIMGLGGLVAVAGGIIFLTYVLRAWRPFGRLATLAFIQRRRTWQKAVIPSNP